MPERPGELIYALDETPPRPHLLALGFQHVAVICPYLVMVALVAAAAKLPHHAAQSAVGLAMIAVAFMTVLQSLRLGPVGSGYLCPPVVSAIYLPSSLAAASSFGFSAVCGMVIFAGACEIAVASLINCCFQPWFRVLSSSPWGWNSERSAPPCCLGMPPRTAVKPRRLSRLPPAPSR